MIQSNPNSPTFKYDNSPFHWQMTRCEKYGFVGLLEVAKPETAIEIGTYKGGSLSQISRHANKVYSLDISPECKATLGDHFDNVEFHTGKSAVLIPEILQKIERNNESLGFVLIDGDHSAAGVKADIEAILQHVPTRSVYIVFHDSFNPPARKGILGANWQQCPYIHYVEVDFIPGVYHYEAFDTAQPRSMYGGLAVALMLPEKRQGDLVIHQSQKGLFDTVLPHSRHASYRWPMNWLNRLRLMMVAR